MEWYQLELYKQTPKLIVFVSGLESWKKILHVILMVEEKSVFLPEHLHLACHQSIKRQEKCNLNKRNYITKDSNVQRSFCLWQVNR